MWKSIDSIFPANKNMFKTSSGERCRALLTGFSGVGS